MLRTHGYTFKPGRKVFKKDALVSADVRQVATQMIVSSKGSGTLYVYDKTESEKESFQLPYTPGTYTLDLTFAWPTSGFVAENVPDDPDDECPVKVLLVWSVKDSTPRATRRTIDNGANSQPVTIPQATTLPIAQVILVNTGNEHIAWSHADFAQAAFAGTPQIQAGTSIGPFDLRKATTLYFLCATGVSSTLEIIEVPK